MEHDYPAFCERQAARLLELAKDCRDPARKDQLVQMAADWLKKTPVHGAATPQEPAAAH